LSFNKELCKYQLIPIQITWSIKQIVENVLFENKAIEIMSWEMRWSNIQFPRRQTNQIVHYLVRVSKFNANQHIFYSILSRINIWLWMKAFKHPLFKKNKKNKRLGYELLFHATQLNSLLYTIHSYNFS